MSATSSTAAAEHLLPSYDDETTRRLDRAHVFHSCRPRR